MTLTALLPWKAMLAGALVLASTPARPIDHLATTAGVVALDAKAQAIARELAVRGADPAVAAFYRSQAYRPLWTDPVASRLAESLLEQAASDGLEPERYAHRDTDVGLSEAFAKYIADLHAPDPAAEPVYVEPQLRPARLSPQAVLGALAATSDQAGAVRTLSRMNPIYTALRERLASQPQAAKIVRASLERARALPADPGRRFVLVDAASATLWMYENGHAVDSMRVIVGKPDQPTPLLAGVIRYAVLRPYWNVPPDLVRDSVAPKVLSQGLRYFRSQNFEALSDWSDQAQVLDPAKVDWRAVASGAQELRVRQRPGGENMMGEVKFMFPNDLGVYLHDTPTKALFAQAQRNFSSGCVRVEDARRLARWLMGPAAEKIGAPGVQPETQVDLPEPTPVYITYLTAAPTETGVAVAPDVYGRDAGLLTDVALRAR